MFGTSIPVPAPSVSSVHEYRYGALREYRYSINTGGTGMDVCTGVGTGIGTTSIPVPDTSETSVKHNPVPDTSVRLVRHQPGTLVHQNKADSYVIRFRASDFFFSI